jgi:hypothetical protein
MNNKKWIYPIALVSLAGLIGLEIARVYYIMPFPGSQTDDTVELAYIIHNHIGWLRMVLIGLAALPVFLIFYKDSVSLKLLTGAVIIFYGLVFYQFNFRLQADQIFIQPSIIRFQPPDSNKVDRKKLVIGIEINGVAKAYPIEIIGYHHQVRDTVGKSLVMITYCTVCRTGRVYKPLVHGKPETFRLVGMDHFNAMFEDATTGSWWRQVSGEAVTGPLKGTLLEEIPSQQMSLLAWLDRYPNTLILQPDANYDSAYADLKDFDEGLAHSSLEKRDTASWQEKSWVIGVQAGLQAKAYDWNDLTTLQVINDKVGTMPIVVTLEPDSVSFHVWQRDSLKFEIQNKTLVDTNTKSVWNWRGQCLEGPLKGVELKYVQSYQEFWHSWRTFHSATEKFSYHN